MTSTDRRNAVESIRSAPGVHRIAPPAACRPVAGVAAAVVATGAALVSAGAASASPPEPRVAGAPAPGTAVLAPQTAPRNGALRPHVVTYRVTFKGMTGGDLVLALKRDPGSDGWIYETHANPSFLARLVVSANSVERGWFTVGPQGVQPQRYFIDDGTRETKRDSELQYDWTAGVAKGVARGEPLELSIAPGTQDPMSIRAHLITELQAGREIGTVPLLDGREVKVYEYRREGTARIKTALGELDTVVYTSERKTGKSGRTWRYWFAPSLGHLPVRIEQRDGSEARLTFAVREVDWRG